MVDRVVAEPNLEFIVKDFQLGADFVHRAFVHLHHLYEIGDCRGVEGFRVAIVDGFQTDFQV